MGLIVSGAGELSQLLAGTADAGARRDPEVWSPLEYGCHLRDALFVQRERVLAVRRGDQPATGMGRDVRAVHEGYAEQAPADVARQLVDAAALFANVLDRLGPDDERTSTYLYPEPAERTLRWVAVHTLHEVRHHTQDVRRSSPESRPGGAVRHDRGMAIASFMVPLGTPAPDFSLPALDGSTVAPADFDKAPALLVAFLCNHCPYVRHIESTLGPLLAYLAGDGLATVGICSNDLENYPEDGPAGMREQASRAGWTFPYLLDADQDVALAYRAACTPDFFLYGPDRTLAWRGQFDGSRPNSGVPVTGDTLRVAVEHTLAGRPVPEPHAPSLGCGIKWKPGKVPG